MDTGKIMKNIDNGIANGIKKTEANSKLDDLLCCCYCGEKPEFHVNKRGLLRVRCVNGCMEKPECENIGMNNVYNAIKEWNKWVAT